MRLSLATVAPLVGFSSRFMRTVLLSHFLIPNELGVAISITVVIATAELISEVGLNHIVLIKFGTEGRRFLAAAHLMQLIRGFLISAALAGLSVPIASFFGVPDLWKSFLSAASIPLMRSFYHLGVYQAQRDYDYRPYAICVGVSTLGALAVAVLLVRWIPDHRIIILSLGCEAFFAVTLSHVFAPIRYEYRAAVKVVREVLIYGLPLTVNGLALALISQADRILVAGTLGVETLALYAVVIGLAQTPISPIFEVLGTVGMSIMVRSQSNPDKQIASFVWLAWIFSLTAFMYAVSVGLMLDVFAPLIYGPHYTVPESWRVLITVTVFLATYRGAPTVLLLTLGHTVKLAAANGAVGAGIVAAAVLINFYHNAEAVLIGKLFGDLMSTAVYHWAVIKAVKSTSRALSYCLASSLCSVGLLAIMILMLPGPVLTFRVLIFLVCLLPLAFLLWQSYKSWKIRKAVLLSNNTSNEEC
jgi:PST family polysaccharide transporter